MARGHGRLKPLQIDRFKGPGKLSDGGGLYLIAGRNGARTWVFRYTRQGTAVELGLGASRAVPASEARPKAAELRAVLAAGGDPKQHREEQRQRQARQSAKAITFKTAAEQYIEANRTGWRNGKHAAQWTSTLATYVYPVFGTGPVGDVTASDVLKVLTPLWATKPETASRVRGRIEAVLDYAKVHGWREGENPARWKGGLAMTLPARNKVRRVKHHAALPYGEVPDLMKMLGAMEGLGAIALGFLILTAARTGEVIGAQWSEMDLAKWVWTLPPHRMKAAREHRVPLNAEAVALLEALPRIGELVFPGMKRGKPLSNMALLQTLRRMKRNGLTAHGFRSSFRDWAAEMTSYPREVIEASLAHTIGTQVERAYLRSDLFEKRRLLMAAWGQHCGVTKLDTNVVSLKKTASRRPRRTPSSTSAA
jgi:integrase